MKYLQLKKMLMLKIYKVVLLFIGSVNLYSQTEFIDANGFLYKKVGSEYLIFDNNSLYGKITYINDSIFISKTFYFSDSNRIKFIAETYFNSNKEFILHGNWQYFNPNQTLIISSDYSHGKRNGNSYGYSDDGSLLSIIKYTEDLLNGEYEVYYPNGNLKIKGYYRNGKKNGYWQRYYENGRIMNEGLYLSETITTLDSIDINELKRTRLYEDVFGSNNVVLLPYKIPIKDGVWRFYDEEGTVIEQQLWNEGKLISITTYPAPAIIPQDTSSK